MSRQWTSQAQAATLDGERLPPDPGAEGAGMSCVIVRLVRSIGPLDQRLGVRESLLHPVANRQTLQPANERPDWE